MSVFALQLGAPFVIGMLAITAPSIWLGVTAGKSNAANGSSFLQLPRSYADGSVLSRMQLQKSEAALAALDLPAEVDGGDCRWIEQAELKARLFPREDQAAEREHVAHALP